MLDALGRKLDGTPAAPDYFSRRRRVMHRVLGYAVRKKRLAANPLSKLNLPEGWSAPRPPEDVVDPRSVGGPDLIGDILTAVSYVGRRQGPRTNWLEFAGARERVALQVKSRANAATAWQLVHEAAARPGMPVVLVAGESTADARRILREHGLGIVDSLGNAHIELPGLLVHVGGGQPAAYARPVRLSGKAGTVAQALLLNPGRRCQVQNLADEARVPDGLAHRVLVRLEQRAWWPARASGRSGFAT